MTTLLKPRKGRTEEAVQGGPPDHRELVADPSQAPANGAKRSEPTVSLSPPHRADLIAAAEQAARDLYACWDLSERIEVYKDIGARFKTEARRVLNIAAARWPEMIPMVNDMPEWKALLSADLS